MNGFSQNWLDIQCKIITECRSALFLIVQPNSQTLQPVAQWPKDHQDINILLAIACIAAKTGDNIVNPTTATLTLEPAFDYLASPLFFDKQLIGVIALKTTAQSAQKQQQLFLSLEQGKHWFELATTPQGELLPKEFYATTVKLLAICLDETSYQESLIALITELTRQFQCGRVTIGELKRQQVDIVALSNSAKFDNRANLMRAIADAMDEAVDQDMIITYPPLNTPPRYINRAHTELAKQYSAGSICTLPMAYQKSVFAVLTLERDASTPFLAEQVRLLEQALALLGPYLYLKHATEKSLLEQVGARINQQFNSLFSLRNIGIRLTALCIIACLITASLLKGDFRVHADAVLEGKIQRVVAAPIEGFILTASVRAGDTVTKGTSMAVMDDADLQLENSKLVSQQQQALREYREARANNELVDVSVIRAKLQQLEAQLQLVQEQLQRTTIVAPFDGVVIEGDLSQLLGAPVERGQKLFKIAPLDGYRIILKVSERLIAYIQSGETGLLSLSSLPDQRLPLTIQKITTLAKVESGDNVFRVEASLQNPTELLRPGMVGVAKINAGRKPILWIWTHELVDWFRLWVWSWWP
ncbi:MAG: efflux RND transporter periplasmic adaptor subunit [Methylococcales bacterium]